MQFMQKIQSFFYGFFSVFNFLIISHRKIHQQDLKQYFYYSIKDMNKSYEELKNDSKRN